MGYDCTIYAVSFGENRVLEKQSLDRLHAFGGATHSSFGQGYICERLCLGSDLKSRICSEPMKEYDEYAKAWRDTAIKFIEENTVKYGPNTLFGIFGENYDSDDVMEIIHRMHSKSTPPPTMIANKPLESATPPAPVIELHWFYDGTAKSTGYLITIPDSAAEGMPHDMVKILANMWNSSRPKSVRISLLAHGVAQIEAFLPPVAPVKRTWKEKLSSFIIGMILRMRKGRA